MLIRKYRAKNLKEALQRVKADLGEEATVLSSRKVKVGLLSSQIEVTATMVSMGGGCLAPRPAPKPEPRTPAAPSSAATAPIPAAPALARPGSFGPPPPLRRPPVKRRPGRIEAALGQPPVSHNIQRMISPLRKEIRSLSSEVRSLAGEQDSSARIVDSLDELKLLLGALRQSPAAPAGRAPEGSPLLQSLAEQLTDCGMRASLVRDVLERVAAVLPQSAEDASTCLENLAARVMAEDMRSVPALESESGPRVVAMVGPPGVGKTCTLIKIATRASLLHERSVGIIGCDTEGIGAIKTLSETARLIGLPCRIAESSADLAAALDELRSQCELILVDTAGCSGRDAAAIQQLAGKLGGNEIEPLLLLNADMRCLEIDANLQGFARLQPAALIFTKLDQAMELGGLYDAARSSSLPMMYLTNGRRIPDDIEEATAEKVASQIMGFAYN